MSLDVFKKIINDLHGFDRPIKVLRMNKIGEPFLNKNLSLMVEIAKKSGRVDYIDMATNGSLFTRQRLAPVIEAGLDRLNISVEGVNSSQYREYAGYNIDFDNFVGQIKWLYANRGNCEITIKIPGNYINADQKKMFYDIFGNYCDRIFIEDIAPIWPQFDIESHSGISIEKNEGQYKQDLREKEVCAYIFYSLTINSDGSVSACCPDWEQRLIVGDTRSRSLTEIWNSAELNALRRSHLKGRRHRNEVCAQCKHITYCQIDNIDPYKEILLKKIKGTGPK